MQATNVANHQKRYLKLKQNYKLLWVCGREEFWDIDYKPYNYVLISIYVPFKLLLF